MDIDYRALLSATLDIGENMLKCGAEVSRVEDSIFRICKSYGVERVDVLTITSCIIVTLHFGGGQTLTETRRIRVYATDFHKLDELNALSRHIVETTPDVSEINCQIEKVLAGDSSTLLRKYLGPVMAAGGFCLFFGGTIRDTIAVAIVSIFETVFEQKSRVRKLNQIAFCFFISFLCGILSILTVKMHIGVTADKIMIGTIMLLIPGVGLTNAIRDLLSGDIITGLLRVFESLLEAGSIACGFAAAILLFGKAIWYMIKGILASFIGSFGYSIMFKNTGKKMWLAAFGGCLTWCVYLALEHFGMHYFMANLISAAFANVYAEVMARFFKAPATIFLIPTLIPLIPGGSLYYTMLYAVSKNAALFTKLGMQTFYTAGAIAVGVVTVSVIFKLYGGKVILPEE